MTPPDLSIIGEITSETTRQIADVLRRSKGQPVHIEINSIGGQAFQGIAGFNALREHGRATVTVTGLAASAAVTIALGGANIRMYRNSMMMIHFSSMLTVGGSQAHRNSADMLEKMDSEYVRLVAGVTGHPDARVRAWLEQETWLTAQDAVDLNFADEVIEFDRADLVPVAQSQRDLWSKFTRMPADIRAIFESTSQNDLNQPA